MKKQLLLLLAMVLAVAAYAQSDRVAILTHEKAVTAYYGTTALSQALTAAADGDVITLSGGVFFISKIDKAVTIIGAGMEVDKEKNPKKTSLINNNSTSYISFAIENSEGAKLTMMNLEFANSLRLDKDLVSANFVKCAFKGSVFSRPTSNFGLCKGVSFLQCSLSNITHASGDIATYMNCYANLGTNDLGIPTGSSIAFTYCTMTADLNQCYCAAITDCVIFKDYSSSSISTSYYFKSGNSLINCLGFNKGSNSYNFFTYSNAFVTDCKFYYGKSMFKDEGLCELTDEAKAAITGTDGTEVGMYGGSFPYNPIPDGSRITKFTVAGKSDTENKLNVEVQVSNGE